MYRARKDSHQSEREMDPLRGTVHKEPSEETEAP